MDDVSVRTALLVAKVAESHGVLQPGDWPDVAVSLLLEGIEDPEIAELAGLSRRVSGWDTEPLVAAACERYGVSVPGQDESADLVARLMADDLRARPAVVTAPMIRLMARFGSPDFDSDLASRCLAVEEYLDCDCAEVDLEFEVELQSMPTLGLPAPVVQAVARSLRSTLPTAQPPHRHHD
ncbi:DUF4034 domain-containing protein [Amycolatopsis sp. TNS106]|uniref:DUF4034 domain-containing protein n=1 Tax=Amycolatopsis sp. TNS106 TaxID=2861750 RepID=UPI001C58635D|nr:DUF4034 domain-containing protein [Amycolatopsis sp. TNS106]QXV56608.1 hypothetical protein CVV72_05955 [Amycolatopsis sp. TNS106]